MRNGVILLCIVVLFILLGTSVQAVEFQVSKPSILGSSGFVPPDTTAISDGLQIGQNPLMNNPTSVQSGIVQSPVSLSGQKATSETNDIKTNSVISPKTSPSGYAPDRLIVKMKKESFSSTAEMKKAQASLNDDIGVTVLDDATTLGIEGMQVVSIPQNQDVLSVAKLFQMHPAVEYAQPDTILSIHSGFVPGQNVVPPIVHTPRNSDSIAKPVQKNAVSSVVTSSETATISQESIATGAGSQFGIMKFSPNEHQQIASHALNMGTLSDSTTVIAHGTKNLLSYLSYVPSQRNQGSCGNCWVWASTGAVEIAKTVQTGEKDRFSIQYFNSHYNDGKGSNWACEGGWSDNYASFYNSAQYRQFVPWSNTNASYYDGSACSSGSCSSGTRMPASYISTTPHYPITSISTSSLNTYGNAQSQAINNIKAQIDQNKAVWWAFFLPNTNSWTAFYSFWSNNPETAVWNPDPYNGITYGSSGGGHAVLIVGYDDSSSNPDEWYWVVLNSWGNNSNRPNGLFRVKMKMDYSGSDGTWPNHYFNVLTVNYANQQDNGSISINSVPSGATVWIDGVNAGKTTNNTISGVSAGSHTVTLKLSGYSDFKTSVTVPSGGSVSVEGILTKTTTTGAISVSSSPTGASVYLDSGSTPVGITPLTKNNIATGTHTIKVSKPGFLDSTKSVTVESGKTTTVSVSLSNIGTAVIPNDQYFSKLYGLHNTKQTGGTLDADIDAPEAWAITQGSPSVIVAVIDTGVDYTHPDLAGNCIAGYDYANNDADPKDDNGHGTHVAGTIAAVGNNGIGIAGVTWNTKIMPLKFLSSSGSGYTSNAIKAINYAKQNGATIASCSWGGYGTDKALKDAITNAPGILFVCAAGNNGKNTDKYPQSPASLPNTNILSVAASDGKDNLASFSNYGKTSVDVAAPGVSILSTTPGNTYSYMSGTSMATPHVSGIAALIKAKKPSLTTSQMKDLIIKYADKKTAFSGKMVSGGRVNANNALKYT